jgi:YD repeat-containing protein
VDNKEYAYTATSIGNMKVSVVKENINSAPYNLLDAGLYDSRDNLKQYHKYTDPTVTIIWGYNYQYPIAEIKNAAFADVEPAVKTVFSVASVEALSALAVPNETKLKDGSLQKALPNALVTTYTYKPLVGILTVTAPNCTVTYYDYDSWGRLKETWLMDGSTKRTLQSYTYHYQNQ